MKLSSTQLQVEERTFFKRFDVNFAYIILALNFIGLVNLYSATHGVNNINNRLFFMQLTYLLAGWTVFVLMTVIDYKFLERIAVVFYSVNLIALATVPFFGKSFYGAKRWLDFGLFRFQPSETMKLAVVFLLAKILANSFSKEGLGVKKLFLPLIIIVIPFALTVKQPDLGTALLIAGIGFATIIFVRVKKSILIVSFLAVLVALPLAWNFGLKKYQKNRVLTFINPNRDPRGAGYNSIQSKIAVGSGRFLGKGFRKGTQSQLEFLPERHTDFIFSVLSEEHGFIGSITTYGLFILLYLIMLKTISQAQDRFGAIASVGILSYLFFHVFINLGMVIGILPIVGVPLPLLSYGGSSLLATMFGLGFVSSVAYRRYIF